MGIYPVHISIFSLHRSVIYRVLVVAPGFSLQRENLETCHFPLSVAREPFI
jgi:hypothetical protein